MNTGYRGGAQEQQLRRLTKAGVALSPFTFGIANREITEVVRSICWRRDDFGSSINDFSVSRHPHHEPIGTDARHWDSGRLFIFP